MNHLCRICKSSDAHGEFCVREMMFGSREFFEYFLCSNCGCLQISDFPRDIARHYEENYWGEEGLGYPSIRDRLTHRLKVERLRAFCGNSSLVGQILLRRFGPPNYHEWIGNGGLRWDDRILDIGCGSGRLLFSLWADGFSSLTGADPFADPKGPRFAGVKVLKKPLLELSGEFDAIILNHSFEHMPDPQQVLAHVGRLLRHDGRLIIRVPLVDSLAWRLYGVNWVQLDAPRHFFLHSRKSLGFLLKEAGFSITRVDYDSSDFAFWGSEQYARGIPLRDPRSYWANPGSSIFSPAELQGFQEKSREANKKEEGDQATFYCQRSSN